MLLLLLLLLVVSDFTEYFVLCLSYCFVLILFLVS